ncbi:MAG: hypothetical protein KKB95_17520 [Gammaproteobacteria bacterium]|nr:hypothetical protein [Gammaproteobacteria bacterium]MBU1507867.1 hypothetical protein [Gammaproteobacteria bacterium]MBU2121365.1 hypothetical protein [Gammaproteobacteria bacterium]MBU2172226.1 hypothetical protein [Gammaproteobacteria bacterium]MBU2200252.1 hypothetical protein [Gammaproteobacteria bacterium]
MDGFDFFVNNFIEKEHRERWRFFKKKGWERVRKNLGQLENQLDQNKTMLVQKNALDFAEKKIKELKLAPGKFIDFRGGESVLIDNNLEKISSNSILVFESDKTAIYFHDEGWIYFCR